MTLRVSAEVKGDGTYFYVLSVLCGTEKILVCLFPAGSVIYVMRQWWRLVSIS